MTGHMPVCLSCAHLNNDTDVPTCTAFPDRIPTEIWAEAFDHRKPYRGDHGVRHELDPDKAKALEAYEFAIATD